MDWITGFHDPDVLPSLTPLLQITSLGCILCELKSYTTKGAHGQCRSSLVTDLNPDP